MELRHLGDAAIIQTCLSDMTHAVLAVVCLSVYAFGGKCAMLTQTSVETCRSLWYHRHTSQVLFLIHATEL